jgi:hypothetical protein
MTLTYNMLKSLLILVRRNVFSGLRAFFVGIQKVRMLVRRQYRRLPLGFRIRFERVGGVRTLAGVCAVLVLALFWSEIALFLGIRTVEAETYHMQTGYFMGDGSAKEISGLGFSPELVIIKANDASGVGAIFKTTAMPQNNTAYLSGATADDVAGLITLTADGFRVAGNNANTANARYTWIAFSGSDCSATGQFCVGTYTGNGGATQAVTSVGFQPDLVWTKRSTAVAPNWRSVSMPVNSAQYFTATNQDLTGTFFTTLDATGFTVGLTNNANAGVYYYVAFKETGGVIDVGTYTGNATNDTNITGVGFVPDFVFVKNANAGVAVSGVYNVTESYGDSSSYFTDTASVVDSIQALQSDGFQIGTHSTANGNTNTLYYAAFGGASDHASQGSFSTLSGTYVGTGNATMIGNLPFAPDLVIIKASTTQAGVFRTRMMAGDSTAYLDSATANFAGGITALHPTGFTVGTAAQVNSAGVTYYWTAYGNAWNPDTHSGSSDFLIGAYYGNGLDVRDITRLPFQPDLITVKRNGATGGTWRTSEHVGDLSSFFAATAEAINNVQVINTDGFEVGNSANVNTDANIYWYFAFATGTDFAVGTYSGTGAVQNIATPLDPDHLWVKSTGATRGVMRTSDFQATTSAPFINVAPIGNAVTQMYANAFTVGTANEANAVGANNYRYAVWHTNTATTSPSAFAMQTGAYMGNGSSKKISGLGFTPEYVMIKSDSATIATVFKTSAMAQTVTAYLGSATADANFIQLNEDGFTVITTANTANVSYTWVAFAGSDCSSSGQFCVGSYTGNGTSPRAITTGFQPDVVLTKRSTAVAANWRSSSMPLNYAQYFTATNQDTTGTFFTSLDATGFTVGATNNVNAGVYYYVAFKETSGVIDVGTYTGNATNDTNITGVGFVPDFVFVKNANAGVAVSAVSSVNESYGDNTNLFTLSTNIVDSIQALQADGFQIGTNSTVNGNTNTLYYAAFGGAPDHTASGTFTMKTGTYTGTGAGRTIEGLGFSPDLVIIKASTTQAGVFRSRIMAGDSTAYLDSATNNFAAGITALNPDGFTVGTVAQVNSAGVTYYWTAYGNAWNPDTNTGASDFTFGMYYGNGISNRDVVRLPFQPDLVTIKRAGASGGTWRTSEHVGNLSSFFAATVESANNIQVLNADGFDMGNAANVNTVGNLYWYFAFATGTNFSVGTYSGTGANQNITTPFSPDYLWVKSTGATRGVLRTSSFTGSTSAPFINVAPIANAVTGFGTSSFSVGTGAEANTSGSNNYRFAVWRAYGLNQMHYHVRNDDGTEADATSATGGTQDTVYTDAREQVPIRLRVAVSNEGSTTSLPTAFRLEYGEKNGTCEAVTSWTRVSDVGGAWDMYDTANLTDADDTTNIALGVGGTSDENTTFLSPNGAVKDEGDEVSALTLLSTNFVELEYALMGTSDAVDETNYCFRVTDAGVALPSYTVYGEMQFKVHLLATSTGTQVPTIDVPGTNVHVGGAFVVQDLEAGPLHTVTDITITETGTVDASSSLDNIRVLYEYDTSNPYDCSSESYSGSETQFGTTDTDGFSGPNGTVSFAGSLSASTTQAICFYPVVDVLSSALSGQTIELSIATSSTDVLASGGDVVRGSDPIQLSGSTTLQDDLLTQVHYHIRNDDGDETSATSVTGGVQDSEYVGMQVGVGKRIRVEVSNEGATTSPTTQYRLEYGVKSTSCEAISAWIDVGAGGGDFDMFNSTHVTDGNDTTDIVEGDGGVSNENTTFKTPNSGIKDTASQTAGITLSETEFVELEYSIQANGSATAGTSYCFRVTDAGTALKAYTAYPTVTMKADVLVSAVGTQTATAVSPGVDQYLGGAFVIKEQSGSRTVTGITIAETGTIDALTDISNVRLYYDLDTSNPYDCASESYGGSETQFGSATSSFSFSDGTAVFTGSVSIATTSTMCLYSLVDVDGTANAGDTIDIEIANPGAEVLVSSGTVNPNTAVAITGSTTVEKAQITQTHYHFRNDDGSESGATSATLGIEDTAVADRIRGETLRIRLEASKGGTTASSPTSFGLEYAERVTTCDAIGSWTPIETPDGAWALSDTSNLTDGTDTTDIAIGSGGVSDSNTVFKTPNGGVRDTVATTSPLTLLSTNYLELEYAVEPTDNAPHGSTYCFRLTGNGAPLDTYDVYPQATIATNQDFYIQRGFSTINAGNTTASITAGAEYTAPSASTSAFIRITNAMHTGAGINAAGGTQNASNVTANISNPSNIMSGITFTRAGTTGNTRIYWEIIEYIGPTGGDNEMKVRHQGELAYTTTSLTATTTQASGVVDDTDVVAFITGQRNPAANTTNYHAGISTSQWNASDNTASFTRGVTGTLSAVVSYAVVEFTGSNWKIQRAEHQHAVAGATEVENITSVNDMARAFIHAQKRVGVNQVDEFGHQVWLSSVGQVSFAILSTSASASTHVSVAWVIENTQTTGSPMVVTRTNANQIAGGVEPSTYSIPITATLSGLSNGSIFFNMWGAGNTTSYPRPIMGATIASTTHYELWISDTGSSRDYRTEIVDWPTAELTLEQNFYQWYVHEDSLDPTDLWPVGGLDLGDNESITSIDDPPTDGDVLRMRMSVKIHGSNVARETKQFTLEYGERTTPSCGAISTWYDVGDSASTTALWRGYNATPLDGTALSTNPPTGGDLNITSVSDRAGTYEEENDSALNPYRILMNEDVEYDWVVQANGVADKTTYCFRMVESDGTPFTTYTYWPTLTTAGFEVEQGDWRWYTDETSVTPVSALAGTNTAPTGVGPGEALKLRVLLTETAGKAGQNVKFKVQYSEFSDFSVVEDVVDADNCTTGSRWCYFDGAGTESATITDKVLYGADACVGGVGAGCGTHNEYSYAPDVVGEVGTTTVGSGGTTIMLQHTYDDPIYIVEAISGDATGGAGNRPAAAIITATTTSSFDVRIQEPDDEADTHGTELVGYIVMERGAYQLPDGRRVDVGTKHTSNYYGNAVAGASDDTCTFTQTFTNAPVVFSALQTNNNTGTPDFLTASQVSVNASTFGCSMEVPDGVTTAPTSPETIGWIAIEKGSFGSNGIHLIASTTPTVITGWDDTPWYEYVWDFEYFSSGPGIVASKQTRNGADGGWVRYDNEDADSVQFAMDEAGGANRAHATEEVGYFAFSQSGVLYRNGASGVSFGALDTKEYEFTLMQQDAVVGQTYFFRLYDLDAGLPVATSTVPNSYPSLVAQSGSVSFSIFGIESGSSTEGVVTDVTTTPTAVPFGTLSLGVDKNAAQRFVVSTNASQGYQVLAYERQNLTAGIGASIQDITGTNLSPTAWATGCVVSSTSCYGYHAGDNTLSGGSTRFLANDTFASLTGTLSEVAYSSVPVSSQSTDIVYRIRLGANQPAGQYEGRVVYIVVPVF